MTIRVSPSAENVPGVSGQSGKFLTTDGKSLSWNAPNSITSLASGNIAASATGLDISSISDSYTNLILYLDNLSATATGNIQLRFNNQSTGSNYSSGYIKSGSTPSNNTNQGQNQALIGQFDSATQAGNGIILTVFDYTNATNSSSKMFSFVGTAQDNAMVYGTGVWRTTNTAINQIQILTSSGTFDTGTYRLFGVK